VKLDRAIESRVVEVAQADSSANALPPYALAVLSTSPRVRGEVKSSLFSSAYQFSPQTYQPGPFQPSAYQQYQPPLHQYR